MNSNVLPRLFLLLGSVITMGSFAQETLPLPQQVCFHAALPEPLRPTVETPADADCTLILAALSAFDQRAISDDFAVLEQFVSANPTSPWKASVQLNLGLLYYRTGYFSRAIESYVAVWSACQFAVTAHGQTIASRAVAELAVMYARVGRKVEPIPKGQRRNAG
jgi:hypothetical protein